MRARALSDERVIAAINEHCVAVEVNITRDGFPLYAALKVNYARVCFSPILIKCSQSSTSTRATGASSLALLDAPSSMMKACSFSPIQPARSMCEELALWFVYYVFISILSESG